MRDPPLRILFLEDNPFDAELNEHALRRGGGLEFIGKRVETKEHYLEALADFRPDVILADYSLPHFSGIDALKLLRQQHPGLPFIFVSGALGEENAIELLHQGANDYILKDRPSRLPMAVKRAVSEAHKNTELQQTQESLQAIFNQAAVGIARVSMDGRLLHVNQKLCQILCYAESDLHRQRLDNLTHPDDVDIDSTDRKQLLVGETLGYSVEKRLLQNGAGTIWANLTVSLVRNPGGKPTYYIVVIEDVHFRKRIEEQQRLAQMALESAGDGITITDMDGTILFVNPAFERITGYPANEVIGQNPRILKSNRQGQEFYQNMWDSLLKIRSWSGEIWNRRKNGEVYPEWLTISGVTDDQGQTTNYVGVFNDISPIKQAQEKINFLAHHDPLTQLPNRMLFHDRLLNALSRAKRRQGTLALMYIDLDRFKNINDTLGHPVGDGLLIEFTRRTQRMTRASDTLARLGGDEFILLIDGDISDEDTGTIARKILDGLSRPAQILGHELSMSASIGISVYPKDGTSSYDLIAHADQAMYEAKQKGRNTLHHYTQDLAAGSYDRLMMENALRQAIPRGELLLHFQPQIDLRTGRMLSVEALARWQHPRFGLIAPDMFIPLAEEIGLISEIGLHVLSLACKQLRAWDEAGFIVSRIAINISAQQFNQESMINQFTQILRDTGVTVDRLSIEVTESVLMRNPVKSRNLLSAFKRLGAQIAIDDFGTGYSSLAYLRLLPLDHLKIDRSFVSDIGKDTNDESIIRAIVALAKSLDMKTIAEGVENQAQADFMIREGTNLAQGYLYSLPLTAGELFEKWRGRV